MKHLLAAFFFCTIAFHLSAQWKSLNVGTQAQLMSISFPSQDTGFISSGYDLWRTADSGNSWSVVDTPDNGNESLYQVWFASAKTGCVGTANGIMKTVDSGQTWKEIDFDSGSVIAGLYFLSDSLGYATDLNHLFITKDGGNTWVKEIETGSFEIFPMGIYFLNANEGFITGSLYPLYRLTDSGKNITTIQHFGNRPNRMYGVDFISPTEGFMSGQDWCMQHSLDSGNTWNESDSGLDLNLTYYSVHFINKDTGYTCGDSGAIFITTNRGKFWTRQNSGTTDQLTQFAFVSDSNIYVMGDSGTLLHTTNGGFTKSNSGINTTKPVLAGIKIYPNPASENIVVETDGPERNMQCRLYNSIGQCLLTVMIPSGQTSSTINVGNYPSSAYFLKVQSDSVFQTEKVEIVR